MAAEEAAEAGRANYKNGDYKAAALCFTEALEDIDAEDTHKLYSNRSACRMHLHDFKGAKEDAESCTALKPSWAKGWARLGAAQGRLGEISEAVASYEKAHELDPTCDEYEREAAKLATPRPMLPTRWRSPARATGTCWRRARRTTHWRAVSRPCATLPGRCSTSRGRRTRG